MRARDEVHAAVLDVDVVEGQAAGDAALVEVAAPVALVLMPWGTRALLWRLGQKLVIPELDALSEQRRCKLRGPDTKAFGREVGLRDQARAGLHDLERAVLAVRAGLPGPVVRHAVLVLEQPIADRLQSVEVLGLDGVAHDEIPVAPENLELGRGSNRVRHLREPSEDSN